ncbi:MULTISPECIES: hypothetical protein [Falsihalocynthiibacter]
MAISSTAFATIAASLETNGVTTAMPWFGKAEVWKMAYFVAINCNEIG